MLSRAIHSSSRSFSVYGANGGSNLKRLLSTAKSSHSTSANDLRSKVSPKMLAIAAAVFVGGATVVGAGDVAVTTLCEEDRLKRWNDRWAQGNVAWHRSQPNGGLVKHYDRFVEPDGPDQAANATSNHRVLVPLCGKTVDMPFLAEKGHEVVGVDGIETAAWQLQRDAWLKFEVSHEKHAVNVDDKRPGFVAAPTFDKQRPGYVFKTDTQGTGYYLDSMAIKWFRDAKRRLSFVVYDFLRITPGDIGTFDRIWDRGALVAIKPEDREEYVSTCDSLLRPGGRILLVTLSYDQEIMNGPPFSIPLAEVQRLYGDKLGYKVESLSSFDARKDYQGPKWDKLQKTGLDEEAFLLTKPALSSPGWFARIFWGRKAQPQP